VIGGSADGRPPWARLAAAIVAGAFLGLAYAPTDLGPLALVALVPLIWAWRGAKPLHAALYGFVFGCVFLGIVLWGLHYLGWVALVPLVLVAAMYHAGMGALVAAFEGRGVRSPWLVAAVWVVVDGLRQRWPLGGLAWAELGVALHGLAPARALASVGGAQLVSFVIVAWNGLVLDGAVALAQQRLRASLLAVSGLIVMIAMTTIVVITRFDPTVTGEIRFASLQSFDRPNASTTGNAAMEGYATERALELTNRLRGRFDLIVFPESALDRDPEADSALRAQLVAVAKEHRALVLVNARHARRDGGLYNANLAYEPDGTLQGIYAKQHLVPYGEYVPLRDELSFIGELRNIPYDFVAGHTRRLFRTAGRRFATVICYESAYADLVTDFVRDGAEAIVVSTSDRSYRRSGMAAQHLAIGQMRAAETGRPLLQATISGISGVVDAHGTVHQRSELFRNTILDGTIRTATGETLFVRLGDWVLLVSGLALIVLAAFSVWRGRGTTVDSGS
jgi:apolipoprotein N-acyltransferase